MKTFKTFISEIDHDDSVFDKDVSDAIARGAKVDGTWNPLPIKGVFWKPGYECYWKTYGSNFKLAVVFEGRTLVYMELGRKSARVTGGNLVGVDIDSVSSSTEVRGTGLVLRTYEALVESGQVLFSSNSQTSGSRKLWEKLVLSKHVEPFVLAQGAAARWYINRYKADTSANVLLAGPMNRMIDEAYADSETCWVALPKDLPGLKALQDGAIDIT